MKVSKWDYHHIRKIRLYLFFIEGDWEIVSNERNLLAYLDKTLLVEGVEKRYLDIEMARVQSMLEFIVAYLLFILNFEATFH